MQGCLGDKKGGSHFGEEILLHVITLYKTEEFCKGVSADWYRTLVMVDNGGTFPHRRSEIF